jgi:uncharacterized protein YcfL
VIYSTESIDMLTAVTGDIKGGSQKHTVNNYPTKLRLKVKFFWSDKNGVVGSNKCM